jgi:hypothetical protein
MLLWWEDEWWAEGAINDAPTSWPEPKKHALTTRSMSSTSTSLEKSRMTCGVGGEGVSESAGSLFARYVRPSPAAGSITTGRWARVLDGIGNGESVGEEGGEGKQDKTNQN